MENKLKEIIKLIFQNVVFWTRRKYSKFMTRKGEPSLDDFYRFVRKIQK